MFIILLDFDILLFHQRLSGDLFIGHLHFSCITNFEIDFVVTDGIFTYWSIIIHVRLFGL